jgi:hypothetical protein
MDHEERRRQLKMISCATVQYGPHIDSLPKHAPLQPNPNPVVLCHHDEKTVFVNEHWRRKPERDE